MTKEPLKFNANGADLLQLQYDLEQRLIPPLDETFHAILEGQNNCAATRALMQVTANIILAVLDRLPPPVRTEFIKSFRSELEAIRKNPQGMSMDAYMEGLFQMGPAPKLK
jgi:hypothetical protein